MLSTARPTLPPWLMRHALANAIKIRRTNSAMASPGSADRLYKNVEHFPSALKVKFAPRAVTTGGHFEAYRAGAARDPRVYEGALPGAKR